MLSGATDLEKSPRAAAARASRCAGSGAPSARGCPTEGAAGVESGEYEGREVSVRWMRCTPETLDELLPPADRAPARPVPVASNGFEQAAARAGRGAGPARRSRSAG